MKQYLLVIILYITWAFLAWFFIFECEHAYDDLQLYAYFVSLALIYILAASFAKWVCKKGEDK